MQLTDRPKLVGILLGVGIYLFLLVIDAIGQNNDTTGFTFVFLPIGVFLAILYVYFEYDVYKASKEDNTDLMSADIGETVEVSGTVQDGSPLITTPLFQNSVAFVLYEIQELTKHGYKNREVWNSVLEGYKSSEFIVQTESKQQKDARIKIEDQVFYEGRNVEPKLGLTHTYSQELDKILLTDSQDKTTIAPDSEKPTNISNFESELDLEEQDSSSGRGLITKPEGTRKYAEKWITEGDTVYIRGTLSERSPLEPITIEADTDTICILTDSDRQSYIKNGAIFVYAAIVVIALGLLTLIPYII